MSNSDTVDYCTSCSIIIIIVVILIAYLIVLTLCGLYFVFKLYAKIRVSTLMITTKKESQDTAHTLDPNFGCEQIQEYA